MLVNKNKKLSLNFSTVALGNIQRVPQVRVNWSYQSKKICRAKKFKLWFLTNSLYFNTTSSNVRYPTTFKIRKIALNYFDKIIRFYKLHYNTLFYAHKAFIVLELQVNTLLVRTKLIPFLFLARDLCYYLLVTVNHTITNNPYTLLSLYDTLSIPSILYRFMYCRQYIMHTAPWLLLKFFKVLWGQFLMFGQNKIWLLANFIMSYPLTTALIFSYPNLYLYKTPLRQLTRLHYRTQTYPILKWDRKALLRLHRAIKLKLFDYSVFFPS